MQQGFSSSAKQQAAFEQLVLEHAPLVKRIAYHLIGRLPEVVQMDDLIQSGMLGLIQAAQNFDENKGKEFAHYAGIRIRGAMLDEVRKNDWLPRSVYRHAREIAAAVHALENQLGRDARDHEVAAYMKISMTEYQQMLMDSHYGQLYDYEEFGINEALTASGFDVRFDETLEGVQREALTKLVAEQIKKLPERECLVLALYYQEELTLKEIGEILTITEARVCQIHAQAMLRLQSRLSDKSNSGCR